MEDRKRTTLMRERVGGSPDVSEQLELQRPDQLPEAAELFALDECDMWRDYWRAHQQSWRCEQEIGNQRQGELRNWRSTLPSIGHGRYPLGGVTLSRADVEWLLASHESGQGPIEWTNDVRSKARLGLDVRGADLRKARLAGLPLASVRGGLSRQVWSLATDVQREDASVHLEGADLLWSAPGGSRPLRSAPGGSRPAVERTWREPTSAERTWREPTCVERTWREPTSVERTWGATGTCPLT